MRSTSFVAAATLVFGSVQGQGSIKGWHPPSYGDVRGPCPMLNTLANHAFLPHSGKGINLNDTIHALGTALNIGEEIAVFLFNFAVTTNPKPNATEFSLENLGRHNILEHDASLSRADYNITHDAVSFNCTVYEETRSYWTSDTITLQQAAAARLARYNTSKATNPNYSMSQLGDSFSAGETAAYLIIMGDVKTVTAPRNFVEYFFEKERLPTKLGWKKPEHAFSLADLNRGISLVQNATGVSGEALNRMRKSREIHGGTW